MGFLRLFLALACACIPLICATSIPADEYRQRRSALRAALGESVAVFFGRTERQGGEVRTGFFQEANFYYLTGWTEPGAILVMTPKADLLLIPGRDKVQEQWTGPKAAPGDDNIHKVTGFDIVLPAETFEQNLPNWVSESRIVYTLTEGPRSEALKQLLPVREVRDAAPAVAKLRMKKSPAEIALIQHATDVAVEAHRTGWKRLRPGVKEHQIAAAMSNVYFDAGCERHAYAPIVGSGPNAAILHYSKNTRRADSGELVLMDVGPECSMYATDLTRTVPVNGKFSPRQRELYEIVLGAQKAALSALKPGVMLGSRANQTGIHKLAADYIASHGKDRKGESLGKYFTHGVGHHIGLDVHDAFDPAVPLEAGMVVTLEPGIYIPEEGIGIRIEDVVLITEHGARVLSEKLPREISEVEKSMAAR
jgi:Xaa-Pro aminopeptidase